MTAKVQSTTAPLGQVIQAQKGGILRDIITADRAFTIMLSGQPNDFTVHIGIGKIKQTLLWQQLKPSYYPRYSLQLMSQRCYGPATSKTNY